MSDYARSPRVLVVEDDADIADVLVRSLRLEGYDVRLATDGVRALDDAHAFLPDLVVLDLGLPRLDGVEVAKQLRADSDDVPTTISSSRSSDRSSSRACAPCCAAARRAAAHRCASPISCSTRTRTRFAAASAISSSPSASSSCSST